jgi:hypothetical protein
MRRRYANRGHATRANGAWSDVAGSTLDHASASVAPENAWVTFARALVKNLPDGLVCCKPKRMVQSRVGSFVAFGFAASVLSTLACGGAKPEPLVATRPTVTAAQAAPPKVSALRRKEVREVIDRGLGYVLSKVEIGAEPHRKDGAFVGFVIEGFRDPDLFVGVDLIPGDVITHVNGQKIERPEQAMAAFESLGKAKELRVSLERKGAPRELVLPIVD